MTPEEQIEEQARLIAWLQEQLERQRAANGELRRAVAELARTFQESLAAAFEAGESGDIEAVRRITRANQQHWQAYLQQIVAAAQARPPGLYTSPSQPRSPSSGEGGEGAWTPSADAPSPAQGEGDGG